MPERDRIEPVPQEAARLIEDCNYSSQRHFETAAHWGRLRDRLGLPTTVLAALTSAAAFTEVFGSAITAGLFALLVTVLTAVNTYLNPGQRTERHRTAGNQYLALRNEIRRFLTIQAQQARAPENELVARLETLAAQVDQLNAESPETPEWAYRKAQQNIEKGQTQHQVDAPRSRSQS